MRLPHVKLFGPLYAAELARLSRRASFMGLKVALVLVLLVVIYAIYPLDDDVVTKSEQAKLSLRLLTAVGGLQLAAVWMLTPWFAGQVLSEERERKTLDLLLTTTLTAYDIIVGKLAARLTFVGAVILAGLPVFVILMILGGVDLKTILLIYAGTFLNLFAIGGMSAGCAAVTPNFRQTLLLAWGILFVGGFCPSFGPSWFSTVCEDDRIPLVSALLFIFFNVSIAIAGIVLAVKSVRPVEQADVTIRRRSTLPVARPVVVRVETRTPQRNKLPVANADEASVEVANPPRKVLPVAMPYAEPVPIHVPQRILDPITAAAQHNKPAGIRADISWNLPSAASTGPSPLLVLTLLFLSAVGIGLIFGLSRRELVEADWMAWMSLAWVPVAMITCASIAPTLTREREADTLMMLLTVPAGRTEILWRKVWMRLQSLLPMWYGTGFIGVVILALTGDYWYWSLAFASQGLGMLIAAVGLGVFLSIHSSTTFLAQAGAIMLMLFAGVLPKWMSLTTDDTVIRFLPLHAAFLAVAGYGGWYSAVRTFQKYCPK